VVFSYNALSPEAPIARWLQSEFDVPWICVVADYPETSDPSVSTLRRRAPDVYGAYQRHLIRQAAGRLYLSWALFNEAGQEPKLHLEGGIAALQPELAPLAVRGPRVVMFTGSLNVLTGIDFLLRAFARVRDRNCELWICGRGHLEKQVVAATRGDARIRYYGMVPRERLHELMGRADVFVNPRPSALPENRANFPSKLLEYLSWARPVISTLTPGVPPGYRSVLLPVVEEIEEGLANTLSEALAHLREERDARSERIRAFVEENLLWSVQIERLVRWLEAENLFIAENGRTP
jgi:glycosyltransferase involved in cell wall biosynthesis